MEKKCRVWKSNTYDLDNLISKESFSALIIKIVNSLLLAEETFFNIHKDKIDKHAINNVVHFPSALELEELLAIDYILTSNELFNVNKIIYNGNNYITNVTVEREVQTKDHFITAVSSSKRIVFEISSNNNNDSISYTYSIPYVYENKRALLNAIDVVYKTLVNLYKDYGH